MIEKPIVPKVGEIYIVRFHPAIGKELKRYRPAMIISSITEKVDSRFASIVAISSIGKISNPFEHKLKVKHYPSLKNDSFALCWYPNTIDSGRLVEKIGEVREEDLEEIKQKFYKLFLT